MIVYQCCDAGKVASYNINEVASGKSFATSLNVVDLGTSLTTTLKKKNKRLKVDKKSLRLNTMNYLIISFSDASPVRCCFMPLLSVTDKSPLLPIFALRTLRPDVAC